MAGVDDPQTYYHVRVLLGIVVGLALTHLLRGVAGIIEHAKERRVSWVHLAWVIWTFIYLLHFWWWELLLSTHQPWTFGLLFFLVLYALLLYLLVALLFPTDVIENAVHDGFPGSRRTWFFAILAVIFCLDFYDTWIKGADYFHSLGTEYLIRNAVYIVMCMVAIRVKNPRLNGVFVIAAIAHQLSWIERLYNLLPS